jgi:purine-binding chemotaxis protein CheW
MNTTEGIGEYNLKATELRAAFDYAFAVPELSRSMDLVDFLSIQVGSRPFALRLTELTRIELLGKVVALPDAHPWLLGLSSSLGRLVPVYSLELALGFERTDSKGKWLAVLGEEESLGLTFDSLERYFRVPSDEIYNTSAVNLTDVSNQSIVRDGSTARPIVNLSAVLAAIRTRVASHLTAREA